MLAEDNCSEVARLVGCWIFEKIPNAKISIAKGTNVLGRKNKSHDVIVVQDHDFVYGIDPTVWQFFKFKRNILIAKTKTVESLLNILEKKYKGNWHISEKINKNSCARKQEWLAIIKKNIAEI